MFKDINWYGQLNILCKYLNTKPEIPFASIQHGYITEKDLKQSKVRNLRFIPFLVWNKKMQTYLNLKNDRNVKIIGAPFIYITKIKKIKMKPKGTLLMFIHSENTLKQKFISEKILQKIKKNYPSPHTISLFHNDFNKNSIKYYEKYGFKVVTFGPRTDKNHLEKLYKSLKSTNYFITDYVGSSFYYALFLKKKTKLIKSHYKFEVSSKERKFYNKFLKNLDKERDNLLKKYSRSKFIPIKDGYKIACKELGYKYLKEKKDLFKILGLDSYLKKYLALFLYKIRPKFMYYKNL